jgi:hypothetical protein
MQAVSFLLLLNLETPNSILISEIVTLFVTKKQLGCCPFQDDRLAAGFHALVRSKALKSGGSNPTHRFITRPAHHNIMNREPLTGPRPYTRVVHQY